MSQTVITHKNGEFNPKSGTKNKFKFTGLILAAVIVAVTTAVSMALTHLQDDPYGKLIETVSNEINLNEQQKSEVIKVENDLNAKLVNRKVTKVRGGKDIEKLFRAENFDRSEAMRIADLQESENRDWRFTWLMNLKSCIT